MTLLKELGFHRRERRDSRMNSALSAASAVKKRLFAVESQHEYKRREFDEEGPA